MAPAVLTRRRRGCSVALGVGVPDQAVEVLLRLTLVHLERVHQLGGKDLLRPRVHLLLTRRKALLRLPDSEIADDLGELVHIAGLDLVAVVLEAAVSGLLPLTRYLPH